MELENDVLLGDDGLEYHPPEPLSRFGVERLCAKYGEGDLGPVGTLVVLVCPCAVSVEDAVRSSKNAIRSPARLPGGGASAGSVDERRCGEPPKKAERLKVVGPSALCLAAAPAENECEVGREDGFSVLSEIVLKILQSLSIPVGAVEDASNPDGGEEREKELCVKVLVGERVLVRGLNVFVLLVDECPRDH